MAVTTSQAVARSHWLANRLTSIAQGRAMTVGSYDAAVDQQVGTNESQWRREVRSELRKSFAEGGKTEAYRTVGGVRVAIRDKTRVPDATVRAILNSDVERVEKELGGGTRFRIPQMFAPIGVESQVAQTIRRAAPIPLDPITCPPGQKPMKRMDGSTLCIDAKAGLFPEGVPEEEAEALYPPPLPPREAAVGPAPMATTTMVALGLLGVGLIGGGIYLATRKKKR